MPLSRRGSNRFSASIWPGFVDAMTALILVLFFVLSIFMIVQFVLRDTITGQSRELDELSLQLASLADTLGLERSRADRQAELVTTLTSERDAANAEILDFEAQVAGLLARNTDLSSELVAVQAENAERLSANEALQLSLAQAREEIDAGVEAARLAAARREAMEAMVASLEQDRETLTTELSSSQEALSETEASRLAEVAAAEALRQRLENSDAELTAMTLSLEAERKKAEETLLLLAAADAARLSLEVAQTETLSEAERKAAQLAQAQALLADEKQVSAEGQKQVALLNQQTEELRRQLDSLQGIIDLAQSEDLQSKVRIEQLGSNLNAALAKVAVEERARAELEARERERLEAEAKDLANYRSEFFGRMREILGDREGVQVVGDRFVFASEVLFPPGSANLGAAGQEQIGKVADVILEVSDEIPSDVEWILRVDGHTDRVPVGASSGFADNWELSQARALSVVKYMIDSRGIPAERLAAVGFGEFQPIDTGDSEEALARNRRIELKLTER